jgi:cell division protein FtsX
MMSYACSIGCVLYRRIAHPELLPRAQWSLGKWGIAVNGIGLAYVTFSFFWSFWPNSIPITLQDFNWSVVLFVGVLVICLLMYVVSARFVYVGPVTTVRRLDD